MASGVALHTGSRLPVLLPALSRGLSVMAATVAAVASGVFLGVFLGIAAFICIAWVKQVLAERQEDPIQRFQNNIMLMARRQLELFRDRRPASTPVRLASDARPVAAGEIRSAIVARMSVNPDALARTPTPFDPLIILHIAKEAKPPIHPGEILRQFDSLFADQRGAAILCRDDNNSPIAVADARAVIEWQYLRPVISKEYDHRVAGNILVLLSGIIFELRKPDIPKEEKQTALIELARSGGHCLTRRYQQTLKIYRTLSNQVETLEEIVLQLLQQVKEDLFREYYSLSGEPATTLNYIKKEVGAELGLDCNPIHLSDPHMDLHDARSPQNPRSKHTTAREFREVFRRIYTPANVLRIMRERLNERIARNNDFCREVSHFIHDAVPPDQRDRLPAPYQFDLDHATPYQLTDEGICFLMSHFQILTIGKNK